MAVYFVESLKIQTRLIQWAMRHVAHQLPLIFIATLLSTSQVMANPNGSSAPNPKTNPADPDKVLRLAFPTPETGFDPVRVNDLYSNTIAAAIFQPLLTYDWMAMPTKLVPNAAEAMPEVSADLKTYTFKVKKGLYFTPDEAFKGKRRELTAQDFVYTLLRHADPKNRSPQVSDLDDKIVGFADYRK